MITEVWYVRAKAACGYFWTTEGSPSVVCACSSHSIVNNVIVSGDEVTDEAEFKQAVADDYGVSIDEVIVIQG